MEPEHYRRKAIIVCDLWDTELSPVIKNRLGIEYCKKLDRLIIHYVNPLIEKAEQAGVQVYYSFSCYPKSRKLRISEDVKYIPYTQDSLFEIIKGKSYELYYCGFALNNCVLFGKSTGATRADRFGHKAYIIEECTLASPRDMETGNWIGEVRTTRTALKQMKKYQCELITLNDINF